MGLWLYGSMILANSFVTVRLDVCMIAAVDHTLTRVRLV